MEQFARFCGFRADTVDAFKIRRDRFWIDQEIRYNWKADIRIRSRSQVDVILD